MCLKILFFPFKYLTVICFSQSFAIVVFPSHTLEEKVTCLSQYITGHSHGEADCAS